MATGADVRDILELGGPEGDAASGTISKKDIINPDKVAGAPERWVAAVKWGGVAAEEMGEGMGCYTLVRWEVNVCHNGSGTMCCLDEMGRRGWGTCGKWGLRGCDTWKR